MSSTTAEPTSTDSWLRTQTVAVTGGQGFLGRRLVGRLALGGARRVVAIDARPRSVSTSAEKRLQAKHITADILDVDDMARALTGCSTVFHLAALTDAGKSVEESDRYFEVNTRGTEATMEACEKANVRRVIYTSTSLVYGAPRSLPVAEDHPTDPLTPYAASKLAGERAVADYVSHSHAAGEVARVANLYGASFLPNTAVGLALDQTMQGNPIRLRNLTSVRDFIHADDVVEALFRLTAAEGADGECRVINVSTGQGASVLEVAQAIAEAATQCGLDRPRILQSTSPVQEVAPKVVLDNSLLVNITGWRPDISIERGLAIALSEGLCLKVAGAATN